MTLVLGIPNKLLILGIIGAAIFIPDKIARASGVGAGVATDIQTSLSALASPSITPVFHPTVGIGGNIGRGIVSGVGRIATIILPDDPSGEPITTKPIVVTGSIEEEVEEEIYGG
jgi:hypothetical protein